MHIYNLQKGNGESLCQIYMGKEEGTLIYEENKNVTGGAKSE